MNWIEGDHVHPAFNAALNVASFTFLILGRIAVARGDVATHRKRMKGAVATSVVFLASYLVRFATTGAHKYPGNGWDRTFYIGMLISHMALAVVLVPLVVLTLRRALRGDYEAHKRMVKFTWPIWLYVSATGVLVYAMLYHLAPALHP